MVAGRLGIHGAASLHGGSPLLRGAPCIIEFHPATCRLMGGLSMPSHACLAHHSNTCALSSIYTSPSPRLPLTSTHLVFVNLQNLVRLILPWVLFFIVFLASEEMYELSY